MSGHPLTGAPHTPWMFGKLPATGDFVSRGLDHARRDAVDHWLSGEMQAARERFADAFEWRYDAAPPWCFVDCDDDGRWSGGALCASVDRAGRRFPVMVCRPATDSRHSPAVAAGCLESLYTALAEGWDADRLVAATGTESDMPWPFPEPGWALMAEDGPALFVAGRQPQGIITQMVEMAG